MTEVNGAEVLRQYLGVVKSRANENKNLPCGQVWAEIFNLEWDEDRADVLNAFAEVLRLPAQIRMQVEAFPDTENKERLVHPLGGVESLLALGLSAKVHQYQSHYSEAVAEQMWAVSDALRRHGAQDPLQKLDEVQALMDQLRDLEDTIIEAEDLPSYLRDFMLRSLDGLRQALRHYRVVGASGLLNEIHRIVGHAGDVGREHPEARDLDHDALAAFWSFIARTADLTTVASLPLLIGNTVGLLPG